MHIMLNKNAIVSQLCSPFGTKILFMQNTADYSGIFFIIVFLSSLFFVGFVVNLSKSAIYWQKVEGLLKNSKNVGILCQHLKLSFFIRGFEQIVGSEFLSFKLLMLRNANEKHVGCLGWHQSLENQT